MYSGSRLTHVYVILLSAVNFLINFSVCYCVVVKKNRSFSSFKGAFITTQSRLQYKLTKLNDQYIQNWHSSIETSSSGKIYKLFKEEFKQSKYIRIISNSYCKSFIRLRTRNTKLPGGMAYLLMNAYVHFAVKTLTMNIIIFYHASISKKFGQNSSNRHTSQDQIHRNLRIS